MTDWPFISLIVISTLLMLPGIAGVLLPALPGIPYMFVVALMAGFFDKFQHLSGQELTILGAIALASLAVDYLAGALGAKAGGASKKAIGWGLVGLIIGLILLPPFGGIIGLFAGIFLAEWRSHRNQAKAAQAAAGGLIGSLAGIGVNSLLALIFLGLFIFFFVG